MRRFTFFWHLAHPPRGQALITEPEHFHAASNRRTVREALRDGWTINVGCIERWREPLMGLSDHVDALRCYCKKQDSNAGGRYINLPPEQWRARIERTLNGTAMPFTTLAEWRAFRFEKLAKMFAMIETDPDASDFMKLLHSAGGPLGAPESASRRQAHRRQRRPGTRRDSALNDKIRVAMRKLTRSQRRGNSDAAKHV